MNDVDIQIRLECVRLAIEAMNHASDGDWTLGGLSEEIYEFVTATDDTEF